MFNFRAHLRSINFLKKIYRKLRSLINLTKDFLFHQYYEISNKKIIYSYFARINNFGDLFNYDLVNFFNYKLIYCNSENKSDVVLLGSILQMYSRNFDGYILGSGFIDDRFKRIGNNWQIKILRGPLSLSQCKPNIKEFVFGDPGILASLIYTQPVIKKYKLGIVPHVSDYKKVRNMFGKDVKVIRAKDSPKKVAYHIQECSFIAASSLHALIFADSYRIPNVHLKFGDKLIGGHHKFKDYYLGMGIEEYEFLNFKKPTSEEEIIRACKLRFSKEKLIEKQSELVEIYKSTFEEIINNRK